MTKGVDVHQEDDEPVHDVLVLVLVLVLVTPEMVTPETLKAMNLLVETGIVDDHVVDGGLVDEHVVDGLVDDHEVVADWQEVVADRPESLGKKGRTLLYFSLWQGVCSCWLGLLSPIGKKVSKSASCGRGLL